MCFQKKQALLWRMTAKLAKIKQFDRRRNSPAGAQKVNKCEVARYFEAPQPPVTHSSHWTGTTSSFNTRSRHLDLVRRRRRPDRGLFPLRAIQQAGIVCWDVTLRESEGSRKKVFMPRKFLVAFPMRNVWKRALSRTITAKAAVINPFDGCRDFPGFAKIEPRWRWSSWQGTCKSQDLANLRVYPQASGLIHVNWQHNPQGSNSVGTPIHPTDLYKPWLKLFRHAGTSQRPSESNGSILAALPLTHHNGAYSL
ncbi:hypothetical protein DFH06DRAFT_1133810 [Mycena polygramma]|nr:hypothetical protein DFH06DRAFT_1133810 [Mycena polygramma]